MRRACVKSAFAAIVCLVDAYNFVETRGPFPANFNAKLAAKARATDDPILLSSYLVNGIHNHRRGRGRQSGTPFPIGDTVDDGREPRARGRG
jgi:hypothetical protein